MKSEFKNSQYQIEYYPQIFILFSPIIASTYIQLLIDRKTWDEKLRDCLALQHFLTDEIAASQVEVVIEGLYLPTTSNIGKKHASKRYD